MKELDVEEATDMVVANSAARSESKMDAKRSLIVRDDLSLDQMPRVKELRKVSVQRCE